MNAVNGEMSAAGLWQHPCRNRAAALLGLGLTPRHRQVPRGPRVMPGAGAEPSLCCGRRMPLQAPFPACCLCWWFLQEAACTGIQIPECWGELKGKAARRIWGVGEMVLSKPALRGCCAAPKFRA